VDPALWELLRAEAGADGDRVLEAIIRFARPGIEIPGVRIVSRFGPIATCRIRARDVIAIRARPDVVSFKAPRLLSPGFEPAFPPLDPVGPALPSTCATDLRRGPALALTGAGVVVASVDWGVDVDSAAFRWTDDSAEAGGDHEAGATRFLSFWDQRDQAVGPRSEPYGYGAVHDREEIDRALQSPRPYEYLGYHPAIADPKGTGSHGTHVLDIAAGNGQAGGPAGIAPGADLIFVHMADRNTGGLANFGDSVRLLEAVDFISRTAGPRPCVINISAGRVCGPKDSTTLVERALDELLAAMPGRFVVNSAGNYFRWRTHSCGAIAPGEAHVLNFTVDPADITVNELEIWYDGADEFAVRIDPPGYTGGRAVRLGERSDLLIEGRVIGRVYHRKHDPNNGDNHIVGFLDPVGRAGNWTVTLEARHVSSGRFHAWIERDDSCPGCQARFTRDDSNPVTTIGTITTSHLPLVVGAYDGHDPIRPAAPFTSGGPSRDGRDKPDFAAPGVGVLAARSAPVGASRNPGLVVRKSGTSMATPHVAGAVALCFEATGNRLSAQEIRSLVLDSCDPITDSELQSRLGRGYLNIARLVADVQQALATPTTVPDAKEPTMDTEDAIVLLAAAPATAYREYLYRPRGQLARWIGDRYDVVARPGQPIGHPLREGDILLEVALGRLTPGRYAILAAGDLERVASWPRLPYGQLLLRPRRQVEMSEPLPVEPDAQGVPGDKDESDERRYGGAGFDEAAPRRDWLGEDDGPVDPGPWKDTVEQKAFRTRVLAKHIAQTKGAPQRDLREDELSDVPGTCSTRHGKTTCVRTATATAEAAGHLLKVANADLRMAQKAGDADALRTIQLSATSGYRSSDFQKQLWLGYFATKYYDKSRSARAKIADGPHSDAAVDYMLRPRGDGGYGIPGRIAAPGYSNHQGGIAIDFWQDRTERNEIGNDSDDESRCRWRQSWFHGWLRTHAAAYGFRPIPTEEWHWEYRPAVKATSDLTDYRGGKLWTFASATHPQPVAVFCPKAALGRRDVDVLVFAHGLLGGCPRPKRLPAGFVTRAPFELGRIVNSSGRPVILVVPLLDWGNPCGQVVFGPGHGRWHPLGKPAVLNAVVSEVLAEVGRVQGAAAPSLRELIVAGHSRAYDILEPLAASRTDPAMRQGALARLSQVWAFDTTYNGDVSAWTDWLKLNPALQMHLYYRPFTAGKIDTKTVGDRFYAQRGGHLLVTQVSEGHCDVPAIRLAELMAQRAADESLDPQADPQPEASQPRVAGPAPATRELHPAEERGPGPRSEAIAAGTAGVAQSEPTTPIPDPDLGLPGFLPSDQLPVYSQKAGTTAAGAIPTSLPYHLSEGEEPIASSATYDASLTRFESEVVDSEIAPSSHDCPDRSADEVSRSHSPEGILGIDFIFIESDKSITIQDFPVGSATLPAGLTTTSGWQRAMSFLVGDPTSIASVTGYTDCVGSNPENSNLRKRRAEAVIAAMPPIVQTHVISSEATTTKDFLETNLTPEGRAGNRAATVKYILDHGATPGAGISKAKNLDEFLYLVRGLERSLKLTKPSDAARTLSVLRQIYYGSAPWTTKPGRHWLWDVVITKRPWPPATDPTPLLGARLMQALIDSQTVDGIDMGHVLAGLDAMMAPSTVRAPGVEPNLLNEAWATWAGDLGLATSDWAVDECYSSPKGNADYYVRRQASDEDLRGDIDSFGLRAGLNAVAGPAQLGQVARLSGSLSDTLLEYYRVNKSALGKAHERRTRNFIEAYGGNVVGRQIQNRANLEAALQHQIWEMAIRFTQYAVVSAHHGSFACAGNNPRHLDDLNVEKSKSITSSFVDWLLTNALSESGP
jgi:subtilisin family serine protease